jgi:putative peptidoglycan lipid II flippase
MRSAALILVGAVFLSRVLGFARESYIAAAFGATGVSDAFYAAFTITDILNYFVAGGTLSITFIPIYSRYLKDGNTAEGDRVFSTIATLMSCVVLIGVVAMSLATPAIAARYLARLAPDHLAIAIHVSRILLPAQLAFYLGALCSATLMARQRFVAAAFAPLIYNLGTIVGGVVLGRWLGIASLAWGSLAGAIVGPFLIQAIAAHRAGLRYSPWLDLKHPELRRWVKLSLPLMIGFSLIMVDDWFLKYFAQGDEGAISRLSYAKKLVQVPIAIAGQALGQASMPFFARLYAEGKRTELGALVLRATRGSAVIAALAGGALAAVAVPAVDLLFRRHHFGVADVVPTASYVAIFAAAIPLWAAQGIVARSLYAAGVTFAPMLAGTLVTLVSLPIYFGLQQLFGIVGLALASDVGILLHTAALFFLLPRRLPEVDRLAIVGGTLRGVALAALAAAPAFLVATYLPHGHLEGHVLDLVRASAGGFVFVAIALALAAPLGVSEVSTLLGRVRARFKR